MDKYCLVCLTQINLLKPCETCEMCFCHKCYWLYRIKYNKHICAMCRQPLSTYKSSYQEIKHALDIYMNLHIASTNEEAKYQAVLELVTNYAEYQPVNTHGDLNYINNLIHTHHKQCEKVASVIIYMWFVCLIYILLAYACVLFTSPSNVQYIACGPSGLVMLYIIAKLYQLKNYIDKLTISNAFIEGFITGACLFYSAIIWNNAGSVFAILTWLLNGATITIIKSKQCGRCVI